jgi:hypothetical protein
VVVIQEGMWSMGASDGGLLRVLRPNTVLSEKTSKIKEYCSVGGPIAAERREGRGWGWRCGGSHARTLESGLSPAHAMIRLGHASMNYKKRKICTGMTLLGRLMVK